MYGISITGGRRVTCRILSPDCSQSTGKMSNSGAACMENVCAVGPWLSWMQGQQQIWL